MLEAVRRRVDRNTEPGLAPPPRGPRAIGEPRPRLRNPQPAPREVGEPKPRVPERITLGQPQRPTPPPGTPETGAPYGYDTAGHALDEHGTATSTVNAEYAESPADRAAQRRAQRRPNPVSRTTVPVTNSLL